MEEGFCGQVLFIDLSTGVVKKERLDGSIYRQFIGGYGLGARFIYERQPAGADPLGPEAILGFTPGLLSATGAPFSGRFMICGKSPLTGAWGDSNIGGSFGIALKQAGYDGLFVTGTAPKPVWLNIENEKVTLESAAELWGQDTRRTMAALKDAAGVGRPGIIAIGPAGEARSLTACVIGEGGRAAGRSGLGAVMGAKQLKAVIVRGDDRVRLADEAAFLACGAQVWDRLKPPPLTRRLVLRLLGPLMPRLTRFMAHRGINPMPDARTIAHVFGEQGTATGLAMSSESGDAPVKNWSGIGYRDFPIASKAARISDRQVLKYKTGRYSCGDVCPVGCGGFVEVPEGRFAAGRSRRPEYETLAAFGTMSLNDNVESIIKCNDICELYGMDTISTGATIAFAIECYEAGIINSKDTGGLALTWGDAESITALTEQVGRREGLGAVLADGVAKAAERLGRGADRFAIHVHGQEPGMHDPKWAPSWATTYLTDPTPGRHNAGGAATIEGRAIEFPLKDIKLAKLERYGYEGKGQTHAIMSNFTQVVNCLGLCMFSSFLGGLPYVEIIKAATGWDYSSEELLRAGERIQTLRHLFNVREGLKPSDFKLHDRLVGKPPFDSGPTAGVEVDVDTMAAEYYAVMGWDPMSGQPSPGKLEELGLAELVKNAG